MVWDVEWLTACVLLAAGYKALFVSVDVPMLGRRLNEYRNGFALPADIQLPNIYDEDLPSVMGHVDGQDTSGHEYGKKARLKAPQAIR